VDGGEGIRHWALGLGEKLTIDKWAIDKGVSYFGVKYRLRLGTIRNRIGGSPTLSPKRKTMLDKGVGDKLEASRVANLQMERYCAQGL
jgi:hypothetical protein